MTSDLLAVPGAPGIDFRAAAIGLLATLGVVALATLLTGQTAMRPNGRGRRMTRNGKPQTPKQKLAAERRARGAQRRTAAQQTSATRERARHARLTAIDRARSARKVCKEASKRRARIRALGKREKAALAARIERAVQRAGGRCAVARAETTRARTVYRDSRSAHAEARGARSMTLEQRRRARAAEKEQKLSQDAIDSALSADIAPALVKEAAAAWFTKSGRFRAPARAALAGLPRAKVFEVFQEWIGEHEGELWQSATDRSSREDPPFL